MHHHARAARRRAALLATLCAIACAATPAAPERMTARRPTTARTSSRSSSSDRSLQRLGRADRRDVGRHAQRRPRRRRVVVGRAERSGPRATRLHLVPGQPGDVDGRARAARVERRPSPCRPLVAKVGGRSRNPARQAPTRRPRRLRVGVRGALRRRRQLLAAEPPASLPARRAVRGVERGQYDELLDGHPEPRRIPQGAAQAAEPRDSHGRPERPSAGEPRLGELQP